MMSNIFNIFSIDWWMDESNNALQMTDSVLFLLLAIPVAYLFLCALFSLGKYKNPYPAAAVQHRFLVLFTVLRNGKEVIESVNRFLDTQQYPRDKYDVAIAATQLPEEDLVTLLQMPVNIVVPDKEYCTKVYAIQQVMERYAPDEYDLIVIFNSDNHIVPNALSMFNNAYYSGCDSIQAHRMAENLNTSMEQNIYTEYLAEVVCYSKKEDNADGYQTQRISWIRSQYTSTFFALRYLPLVLLKGEWDYALKLFQWLMPSRFLLIALILLCTAGITLLNWTWAPKWYVLLATLILAFLMALPEGEVSRRLRKALWALPVLMFTAVFSHIKRFFYKKK